MTFEATGMLEVIEKNTAFGRWHQIGQLKAVQEVVAVGQFERLVEVLTRHHYEHYEVSLTSASPGTMRSITLTIGSKAPIWG